MIPEVSALDIVAAAGSSWDVQTPALEPSEQRLPSHRWQRAL